MFSFTLCFEFNSCWVNLPQEHRSEAVRRTVCFGQSFQIFFKIKNSNQNVQTRTIRNRRGSVLTEKQNNDKQLLWSRLDAEEKVEHLRPRGWILRDSFRCR